MVLPDQKATSRNRFGKVEGIFPGAVGLGMLDMGMKRQLGRSRVLFSEWSMTDKHPTH